MPHPMSGTPAGADAAGGPALPAPTVEKIGGTSMSRADELVDTLLVGHREGAALSGRILVVSAFGGVTDLLLEDKGTGAPGVFGLFAASESGLGWSDALDRTAGAMDAIHTRLLEHPGDRAARPTTSCASASKARGAA